MMKVEEINVTIRKSRREDMLQVFKLIKALAEFERLDHTVTIDAEVLAHDGFDSDHPAFTCLVAELSDGHIMGYALYYTSYSTWLGRSIFLEDLYVQPAYRRNGIGRQLFLAVAKIAHETHSQRMEFHVLSWNPAIDFYKSLGATDMTVTDRWHHFRIDKLSLDRLFPPDRPQASQTPRSHGHEEANNGRQSISSNDDNYFSGRCSIDLTNNHLSTRKNNGRHTQPNFSIELNNNYYGAHSNNNERISVHSNNYSTHVTDGRFSPFSNDGRESIHSNDDRFSTQLSDSHFSTHTNDGRHSVHTNDDSFSILYRSDTPYSAYDGRFSAHLNSERCPYDGRQSSQSSHI